jgi:hypothetical protein
MGRASDGRPLWDGRDEIYVREADPEEAKRWKASFMEARQDGDAEDAEDWVIRGATGPSENPCRQPKPKRRQRWVG